MNILNNLRKWVIRKLGGYISEPCATIKEQETIVPCVFNGKTVIPNGIHTDNDTVRLLALDSIHDTVLYADNVLSVETKEIPGTKDLEVKCSLVCLPAEKWITFKHFAQN